MPEDTYTELLRELSFVGYKRLMYGEWLADECEDCHTTENVSKFVDRSGKTKQPIYLCRKCYEAGGGSKHLAEWRTEQEETIVGGSQIHGRKTAKIHQGRSALEGEQT